jgi:hypothetical protein
MDWIEVFVETISFFPVYIERRALFLLLRLTVFDDLFDLFGIYKLFLLQDTTC